jgi:predicted RND superfamily exporter protein
LAAKNAILIVEFARSRQQEGASRFDAAVEAAKVRLRPIIMTSFAFILGVLPLVIAQGAGAEMRRTLGTAVFAGMIGVTLFGIFLTPVFYYVIRWFSERHSSNAPDTAAPQPPAEASIPAPSRRVVSIEHQESRGTRLQSTSDILGKSSDRREE